MTITKPELQLSPIELKIIELEKKYMQKLGDGAEFSVLKEIKTDIRQLKESLHSKKCGAFLRMTIPKDNFFY